MIITLCGLSYACIYDESIELSEVALSRLFILHYPDGL